MRSSHSLDRLETAFDDDRLVANAGLLLPATLAQHLGLQQLVDAHLDLGAAPGRANVGDKLLTLIASALAGGDCIDDADALRAGGTASVLGCAVKAPSTLGTFLRSFRWGHVRQLDRVTRELLARAWATGAGPGAAPFTIDLDSTICETYGLAKEGARHHGYTGVRGYHPLLAVAAGSGDVLMARCARAVPTPPGGPPTSCVRLGRVAGASGQLTMRADSGFYAHAVVAVCRKLGVRFSITIRQQPSMRRLIEAIPEAGWTPIEYWLAGRCRRDDVHPVQGRAGRRVGAADRAAGETNAGFTSRSSRAITRSSPTALGLELEADHRRAGCPRRRARSSRPPTTGRPGSGRHDQDAPAAALRSRRAAHSAIVVTRRARSPAEHASDSTLPAPGDKARIHRTRDPIRCRDTQTLKLG